ncbi:MAG: PD-(D/E)XK nuclease family protein, partial [Betaproteobacteria bacterium]
SGTIRRLALDWIVPPPPPGIAALPRRERTGMFPVEVEFSWASETAKHVGTVVHRALQSIAEDGLARWDPTRATAAHPVFARELRVRGVPEPELERALSRVVAAVHGALADERARWLLSDHGEARSEWRLTGVLEGELVDIAIDRTFVDAAGVRWVVDYKTGAHEGADPEAFLDNERERYRVQLERYAALLAQLETRPTRLALYFPLLRGWREWTPSG